MIERIFPSALSQSEPVSAEYRYELKVASGSLSPAQARSWIRMHPEAFQVAYEPRIVNNLYFDTSDLQSFNDNLAGVSERQKLRLRWYGAPAAEEVSNPVLELKRKQNLLGSKRQEPLKMNLDLTQPFIEIWRELRSHASQRWQTYFSHFTQPALINHYRREYFVTPDMAIRATLDYDLVAFEQRMSSRPNLNRPIPVSPKVVIEVKTTPEHHDRLQELMGFFPIIRSQNSKYVQGVAGGLF